MESLTDKQRSALNAMILGKNVLITGSAGVGKSYCVSSFKEWIQDNELLKIAVTSTTGASALLIGGITIHSWAGIGHGKDPIYELIKKIRFWKKYRVRWKETNVLIIDEISMMDPELFDKLNQIGKAIRGNPKPFGGMQIVLVGDFCQLKPVQKGSKGKKIATFCFEAKCWDDTVDNVFHFTEIIRQKNKQFQETLNHLRMGLCTPQDRELLESRVGVDPQNEKIVPTKLYSHRISVKRINRCSLHKLKTQGNETKKYTASIQIENENISKLTEKQQGRYVRMINSYCQGENVLELAIGSQVMLIANLDLERGYANGSRGVVTSFSEEGPIVDFKNGKEEIIREWEWKLNLEDENVSIIKLQIPLILADACTIHKIQGSTLDYVEVDLSSVFECGQSYTALSRVRELEGLFIKKINYQKIRVHPKVKRYYDSLSATRKRPPSFSQQGQNKKVKE
jgi:ATP-dependent DNA helicase PIF1